jgi:photosystem II stability/assembly factor-like uncharacterized protein
MLFFHRRLASVLVLSSLIAASAGAAEAGRGAVADAWERPPAAARLAERSVLLGAAQAGARMVAVGERGIVVVSDDGGKRWAQSQTPVSVTLTAVRFADAERGFAVGHGGTVLASTDGGRTWTRKLDGRRIAEFELQAAKAGTDPARLKSAQRFVADGPDKPLLDLLVFDAQHVLVVGAYGIALETRDGGTSWTPWRARLDNPKELHLYAVRKRGERIVIAGEQGLLLQSNDAGATFKRIATPYQGSFFTAELPADAETVVAGLRGNAWRSVDNGANWSQLASPIPVSITSSAARADGSLVFANQAGLLLAIEGGALKPLPAAPLPPLSGLLATGDGHIVALSIRGVHLVDSTAPIREQPR